MKARLALAALAVLPMLPASAQAQKSTATLQVPERLYAGYLGAFAVKDASDRDGNATVSLQRRVGSGWAAVTSEPRRSDATELYGKLPAGRQSLRAVVVTDDGQRTPVASRTLTVLREGRRTPSRRDDGRYAPAKSEKGPVRFSIAGGGKTLRGFQASVTTFCFGPTIDSNRLLVFAAKLDPVRVAPDGAVVGVLRTKDDGREALVGRLRSGRFTGTIDVSLSTCNGQRKLTAVRVR